MEGAIEWFEIGLFISWPLIVQQNTTFFDIPIANTLNTIAIIALALLTGGARALGG